MTDPVDSQFPESSGSAVGGAAALASTPDMAAAAPEGQGAGVAASADASAAASQGAAPAQASADSSGEEIDVRRRVRKRPKPGERRLQILQALAAKLSVSEAALYRHFASKAQMFEGLIEFIESTLFGLINQITREEEHGLAQVQQITNLLLTFSERNPGMTRVLVGDALINEDDRLQVRINQLTDRLELSLKQCFRTAMVQEQLPADTDAGARADLVLSYVLGRWARYAKGGFKRMPTENVSIQIGYFVS